MVQHTDWLEMIISDLVAANLWPGSSSSLLLSSLELSDTHVYEPYIRALFGTASHICEVFVLKLIPVTDLTPRKRSNVIVSGNENYYTIESY